jgi:hypothetical protein
LPGVSGNFLMEADATESQMTTLVALRNAA